MIVAILCSPSRGRCSLTARPPIKPGARRSGRARTVGLARNLMARWGELQLQAGGKDATLLPADPAGVDMDRVVSTMRVIGDVESERLAPDAAMKAIGAISQA